MLLGSEQGLVGNTALLHPPQDFCQNLLLAANSCIGEGLALLNLLEVCVVLSKYGKVRPYPFFKGSDCTISANRVLNHSPIGELQLWQKFVSPKFKLGAARWADSRVHELMVPL